MPSETDIPGSTLSSREPASTVASPEASTTRLSIKTIKGRCIFCDSRFYSLHQRKEHQCSAKGTNEPYWCQSCGKAFRENLHRVQHHVNSDCARSSTLPNGAEVQQRTSSDHATHSRDLNVERRVGLSISCFYCEVDFEAWEDLNLHECAALASERPYWCRDCSSEYPSAVDRIVHRTSLSCQEKPRLFVLTKAPKVIRSKALQIDDEKQICNSSNIEGERRTPVDVKSLVEPD